ncbi:MAG: hypothetical protein ACR2QW_09020 [bacterium]
MMKKRYPIIVLWAHPRSMSTATERIMRERGDCHCLHEPFMYYYYVHLGKKKMPHFKVEAGRPTNFNEIVDLLFEAAERSTVFSKDMAYYVLPEIQSHPEMAHELTHVFLIRDPRRAILSYHRLDPDLQCTEVGIESQWQLYQWIQSQIGRQPLVMRAEEIQDNPQAVIGAMWQRIGLEIKPEAFEWNQDDAPDDWKQVNQWHHSALKQQSIKKERMSEQELQKQFDDAAKSAPRLQQLLEYHLPYYRKLAAAADRSPAK